MRFVHTADWQIGKPFLRFGEKAAALRAARLDAIEALGRLALAEGAAHVLVAGDVYDADTPTNVTLRAPIERMRGFPGVTWLLLPGNHDPHRPGGAWERLAALGLPANVRPLLASEPVALGAGCFVLPAPLATKAETRDLTARFDDMATPDGAIRIGLAHGAVTQFGQADGEGEATNAIDPARPARAGLDYLALGDWHRTQEINPRVWYAGTPEPDRHRSQTEGAALLVVIDHAGAPPQASRKPTGTYHWRSDALALSEAEQLAGYDGALRAGAPLSKRVLELSVSGAVSLALRRALGEWLERWQAAVFHLDADLDLRLRPDPQDLEAIDFDGVLRRVAETLKARALDETLALADRRIAEEALLTLHLEAVAP